MLHSSYKMAKTHLYREFFLFLNYLLNREKIALMASITFYRLGLKIFLLHLQGLLSLYKLNPRLIKARELLEKSTLSNVKHPDSIQWSLKL
jgi:hypothetical protein